MHVRHVVFVTVNSFDLHEKTPPQRVSNCTIPAHDAKDAMNIAEALRLSTDIGIRGPERFERIVEEGIEIFGSADGKTIKLHTADLANLYDIIGDVVLPSRHQPKMAVAVKPANGNGAGVYAEDR